MSHTYSQNVIHVVFSTKERRKIIAKESQPALWSYAAGICQKHEIFVYAIGGMEDHLHLVLRVPPALAVAKAVNIIKANCSRWVSQKGYAFGWQQGYGVFSVSASIVPAVTRYVRNQEAHHKKMTFDDEFVALLKKHGVEFDPKFVFG